MHEGLRTEDVGTELRLADSPRMLQNEMEKSLECATLVTAVELISV